eukprot:TRINITY_DN16747_c0_g1_i1.p1 TRINITY_DN16747_c0_g1~~TRINITY_DN16747_c0_g1_i1.p1  ORF type:complete len:163 (-),score=33.39 TRINITY_DN16747_c0_g1_i1:110-598(-)
MESPLMYREKRKHVIRSAGSFSVLEEKIIAPTPRKIPNIGCSPRATRKEKSIEESLFGEAGFEIQNILLQIQVPATEPTISPVVQQVLMMEEDATTSKMIRAPNPITFHFERTENVAPAQPSRVYQGRFRGGCGFSMRKELNRSRSASWPGLPKTSKKTEMA